ncbi:DUF6483 family protein [Clostridium massiliamazoniense]|uniref:DUF6483 family protein n=1 Tax=Clostridium massiliamazoniense TaxID=1347366 RepID=UPI0006D827F5|nr:DUF6483 family protein [Clostridium massiliamazoniense]
MKNDYMLDLVETFGKNLGKTLFNEVKEVEEWFYNELSLKSGEALEKGSFSRDEVEQGLKDFIKSFKNLKD